jgi:hypothetical protein
MPTRRSRACGGPCPSAPIADTLDVRATVDGFLGLPAGSPPHARSLLAPGGSSAKMVPVVTTRSDSRKTWFLHIHPGEGARYLFNLHPDGDGRAMKGTVRGYAVDEVPLGNEPAAWQMLADSLKLHDIAPSSIHAGLRARIEERTAQ